MRRTIARIVAFSLLLAWPWVACAVDLHHTRENARVQKSLGTLKTQETEEESGEGAPEQSPITPARPSGNRAQHEASALLFAHRRDWAEATAHARSSGEGALQALVQWMRLKDGDNRAPLADYAYFLNRPADGWPDAPVLLARARESVLLSGAANAQVARWYALAQRYGTSLPGGDLRQAFIRDTWIEGNFTPYEEEGLKAKYGQVITPLDDVARVDRLLWLERFSAAERLIPTLPAPARPAMQARLSLLRGDASGNLRYASLSSTQKTNPGVIYAAMRAAQKRDNDVAAESFLLRAPKNLPYPEKWWRARASLVRDAIEAKDYRHAQKLLDNHALLKGDELADALWLEGWLNYEFRDNPKEAYKLFYRLNEEVKFPVSKARAAYWAGMAAQKNGNADIARRWFQQAAAYPTQFYGQLAAATLKPDTALSIPKPPTISAADRAALGKRPAVEALRILMRQDEAALADKFLSALVDASNSPGEIARLGELGTGDTLYLGVKAAKRALRGNVVLLRQGWPHPNVKVRPAIEPGLMYAISRQESEFRANARSSADAIGMMQLLPKTAEHTARKHDMKLKHTERMLLQPAVNMQLGSYYLGDLIQHYDGNYMLAIAAYNAGPRNVNRWIERFGTPGKSVEQSLRWLEQIPFAETRNYVQRVLENLQIYRQILAQGNPPLRLKDDLVHRTKLTDLPQE